MFSMQRRSRLVLSVTALLLVALFSSSLFGDPADLVEVEGKPGLYQKVIVSEDGVKLCRSSDGKGADLVDPFAIFFRHKTEPKNGYLRVADGGGKPLGWIKEDSVISWNTRFVLSPTPPQSDGSALHIKGKDVQFKWTGASGGKAVIVPILEEPGKERNPVYTLAIYAASSKGKAPVPSAPKDGGEMILKKTQLEICFVIDTTNSMEPLIDGTKKVVEQAAESIEKIPGLGSAVKFGLVEYRDSTPAIAFDGKAAKVVTKLGPVATLQKKLLDVVAATDGSEDTEEDVLAGLLMAIEDANWAENSSKHIILLGDASAHLAGPKNTTGLDIETVISRARKASGGETTKLLGSINFHAVRAHQNYEPAELAKSREQFQTLSGNAGFFEGLFFDMDATNESSQDEAVRELTTLLTDGFGAIGGARRGVPIGAGPPKEASPIEKAVWDIIGSVKGKEVRAVERGTATIRSADGDLLAQKMVMVSEPALRRLRSTLDLLSVELSDKADPTKRGDVGQLLKGLKSTLLLTATGQDLSEDTQLEAVISSLPLKTDVLRTSVKALAQKDKESFEKWLAGLEGAKKRAQDLLESQAGEWVELSGKGENEKYAYILLTNMP